MVGVVSPGLFRQGRLGKPNKKGGMCMTYQWKIPLSVSADVANKELEAIAQNNGGVIDPQTVVDVSRSEDAPLHNLFEWDDSVAAEKYRVSQARFIIRNITVCEDAKPTVRQFVHAVQPGYVTIHTVLKNEEMKAALLDRAVADMAAFRAKYRALEELYEVVATMEKAERMIAGNDPERTNP